jgi:hypothetical protein
MCRVGIASVTQLTTLSVSVPLSERPHSLAQREANRRNWPAAAAIADYAFSRKCLSSMPRLRDLTFEMQHISPSSRSSAPTEEAGSVAENNNINLLAAWQLPSCNLTSFSVSGVALGPAQLNNPDTQVS